MNGLHGEISFWIEYRPCIVKIPAEYKKRVHTQGSVFDVYQEIVKPEENIKALFHCWNFRSELCDASPMIGGHPGGQISKMFAIVENENGEVMEVEPWQIKFVDNKIRDYSFPEMEKI